MPRWFIERGYPAPKKQALPQRGCAAGSAQGMIKSDRQPTLMMIGTVITPTLTDGYPAINLTLVLERDPSRLKLR
jgi:hypothetical protein